MSDWFRPAGSAARDGYDLVIAPGEPGWSHTGLRTASLAPGESRTVEAGECEWIVLPLSGSYDVSCGSEGAHLAGRAGVFAGPSDLAYVGRDASFTVTADSGGRVALLSATARAALPFHYQPASAVPVELRGAGQASRQVQNFGTPGVLPADSIIACEVITPAGNWSSYPPHKHDTERPGVETSLEEIYYFEMRVDPAAGAAAGVFSGGAHVAASSPCSSTGSMPQDGLDRGEAGGSAPRPSEGVGGQSGGSAPRPFGYQRVYGTTERPISVLEEVHSGDVVLVPHGWHGPAMAPTGYDMYYLNVMAGPGPERAWLICDDPAHAWVRDSWAAQPVDPRLPLHDH